MTINLTNIKSALVSVCLMAILSGSVYIIESGDIFAINWRTLVNIGSIALLTGIVSIIKSLLTNSNGVFAGSVKVK